MTRRPVDAGGALIAGIPRRAPVDSRLVLLWPADEEGGPGTRRRMAARTANTSATLHSNGLRLVVAREEDGHAAAGDRPADVVAHAQDDPTPTSGTSSVPAADQPGISVPVRGPVRAVGSRAGSVWKSLTRLDRPAGEVLDESEAAPLPHARGATEGRRSRPALPQPHPNIATVLEHVKAPASGPLSGEPDRKSLRGGRHWLRLCLVAALGMVTGSARFGARQALHDRQLPPKRTGEQDASPRRWSPS